MAEVAVAGVIAQVEPDTQGPIFQPEPTPHAQGEVIPDLISPHTPLPTPGHISPAPLVPTSALPIAPTPNVDLNVNPNPNPAQPVLLGSFYGVGGIQFDEVPENLDAEVPAGPNIQEPIILPEHGMPNEAAFSQAPFVQPLVPMQAMPAVAMVVQVADDILVQEPLLGSFHGFEAIQFGDGGEDEDQ
ncbi:hypothetical protein FRC06_010017 [Ceratobasidium sp. 370]|nr:hypothetical protein FRC06_010017 [Ceratobasidium sp. 370]